MLGKIKDTTKKTLIGTLGGLLLLVGIVMIPYPGPGWLVVFASLAILATEFEWARRINQFGRKKYDAWNDWQKRQKPYVRGIFWCMTAALVVVTIWLFNGYGMIDSVLGLGWDWVHSPLPFL